MGIFDLLKGAISGLRRDSAPAAGAVAVQTAPKRKKLPEMRDLRVRCTQVEDVSPTARRLTFAPVEPGDLPPFEAGQYVSFELKIGRTLTTRPYSIASAPFEARCGASSMFQIVVRNGKPGTGFAANWLYGLVKPGDEFDVHLPCGEFVFDSQCDAPQVVALAGGTGVVPFVSMAREISHGTLDCDLTILYGSATPDDIVLHEELDALADNCDRVRLVHLISGSDEPLPEDAPVLSYADRGFFTAELIARHAPVDPASGEVSFFLCGPQAMYGFARAELEKLGVPAERVRTEVFGGPNDVTQAEGYPAGLAGETFELTVERDGRKRTIPARATEPLAVALERAGMVVRTRCRSGACASCEAQLVAGEAFVPAEVLAQGAGSKAGERVRLCSTYPLGSCTIA